MALDAMSDSGRSEGRRFAVRLSEPKSRGEDWPGTFSEQTSEPLNEALLERGDDLIIYVWQSETPTGLVGPILEMLGNRTVKPLVQCDAVDDDERLATLAADLGAGWQGRCELLVNGSRSSR